MTITSSSDLRLLTLAHIVRARASSPTMEPTLVSSSQVAWAMRVHPKTLAYKEKTQITSKTDQFLKVSI